MISRKPDWVPRLRLAIDKRAKRNFRFGGFDCCMAAGDLVKAQTGTDPGKRLRGYKTFTAAMKALAKAAPKGTRKKDRLGAVASILAQECGMVETPVLRAGRGCVVLVNAPTPRGPMDVLGIVDLTGTMILIPAEKGWEQLPLSHGHRAWGYG